MKMPGQNNGLGKVIHHFVKFSGPVNAEMSKFAAMETLEGGAGLEERLPDFLHELIEVYQRLGIDLLGRRLVLNLTVG